MENTRKIEKNILFFFHSSDLNNGATRSMIDVIENLVKNDDVNVVVLYPDKRGSAIKYLEDLEIKTYNILYGRWDYPYKQKTFKKVKFIVKSIIKQIIGLLNTFKILNIIKKEKINIIYSNTSVIYEGAILNKITKIPHIWHIREFGKEDHALKNMYGDKKFYKYLNNYTNIIIFISNSVKQKFMNQIENKTKNYVIYNDISKEFINPKQIFNDNKKLKITIIGTIQEGKGQLEVVKAVKILKDKNTKVELHIAGKKTGQYYYKIRQYVQNNELDDFVIFDGFIQNVNEYRKNFDVGIVASSNEAFGRVTIEGMLSGLVMIGADSAGTKELIKDNENGMLYKLHNERDLAEKIQILNDNRELLKNISNNGFNYAINNFTRGKASNQIYNIINDIMK